MGVENQGRRSCGGGKGGWILGGQCRARSLGLGHEHLGRWDMNEEEMPELADGWLRVKRISQTSHVRSSSILAQNKTQQKKKNHQKSARYTTLISCHSMGMGHGAGACPERTKAWSWFRGGQAARPSVPKALARFAPVSRPTLARAPKLLPRTCQMTQPWAVLRRWLGGMGVYNTKGHVGTWEALPTPRIQSGTVYDQQFLFPLRREPFSFLFSCSRSSFGATPSASSPASVCRAGLDCRPFTTLVACLNWSVLPKCRMQERQFWWLTFRSIVFSRDSFFGVCTGSWSTPLFETSSQSYSQSFFFLAANCTKYRTLGWLALVV